jgi:hypothetical protein
VRDGRRPSWAVCIERRGRENQFGDLAKRALGLEQVRREEEIYIHILSSFLEF